MKFMRRNDLSAQKRIDIALLAMVWQGCYGKMTQIAQHYQISRTFLYQLLAIATLHLEVIFSDERQLVENDSHSLHKMILLLRLEGRCSLQSISCILKELEYSPNSVGYLSEFLQRSGRVLPSTLSMPSQKFVFFLSDEIFAIHSPLLVTIDAQSTAILKIELGSDRSAETWKKHFEALGDHRFVPLGMGSDRGLGLVNGFHAAFEAALWVCDYFHEFRDLLKLQDQLEIKAYGRITDESEAIRKFGNAKSDAHLEKRLNQYETAVKACKHAIEVYDQLSYLTQELRELLQLCSPHGLKSKAEVKPQLEALLSMVEEVNHVGIKGIVTSLKKHLDEILVPFDQLDQIKAELLETIDANTLEYLYQAWHHEHFSHQSKSRQRHYHQSERDFWLDMADGVLSKDFQNAKTLVFNKLDSIVRGSSLIEMVNSIIRPYLNNSKGQISQESLNLIMFYHNHRPYKSGKRKGNAPIELLTGVKLTDHWCDLLIQTVGDSEVEAKRDNLIPFTQPNSKLQERSENLLALEQYFTEHEVRAA